MKERPGTPDTPIAIFSWSEGPKTFTSGHYGIGADLQLMEDGTPLFAFGPRFVSEKPVNPRGRKLENGYIFSKPIKRVLREWHVTKPSDFS